MLQNKCHIDPSEQCVYDWDEKYKLALNITIENNPLHNTKKINTSIAIGISKQSPYFNKDDSNMVQMKNEINNNSIFHRNNMYSYIIKILSGLGMRRVTMNNSKRRK